MEIVARTKLKLGLEKPVTIVHVTDVHLTESNNEDTPETVALMKERKESFHKEGNCPPHTPNEYFEEVIRMAEDMGAVLVCTGDVMDVNSAGNRAEFHRIADGHDMMYSPGGHETQRICRRTMEEEYPYVETVRPAVEAAFPQFDFNFESRVINGLNIITADNGLDYFKAQTVERFKKELERGLPILIFFHDPIDDARLNATEKTHPNVRLTPEDYRISHEMIDLINTHPLVKASFAGHQHPGFDLQRVHMGKPVCIAPSLFRGGCRIIEVE